MMQIEQTDVYEEWFLSLPDSVSIKIKTYVLRVQAGNTSNCKSVGDGVYEIRVNYQKGYRVYYTIKNKKLVLLLLCGGDKKSQKDDIKRAKKIKKELEG